MFNFFKKKQKAYKVLVRYNKPVYEYIHREENRDGAIVNKTVSVRIDHYSYRVSENFFKTIKDAEVHYGVSDHPASEKVMGLIKNLSINLE